MQWLCGGCAAGMVMLARVVALGPHERMGMQEEGLHVRAWSVEGLVSDRMQTNTGTALCARMHAHMCTRICAGLHARMCVCVRGHKRA